ncbi:caspase-3-like [Mytilus galloprovincialis]|uniref:caspase-3-like n=1 Tax=Mytilus galloprovincialis TaxID=29158 RepID=UPI003F7C1E4D
MNRSSQASNEPYSFDSDRSTQAETNIKLNHFETDARPTMRRTQSWLAIPDIYQMKEEFYNMNHARRGDCVIFNIKHVGTEEVRAGSEQDVQRLTESFSFLGFEVIEKVDLTKKEIIREIHSIADKNHYDNDCFVCVILSHGREGYVHTTDGEVSLSTLFDPIKNCKSLLGKPKLFFIQACRGNTIDFGNLVQDGSLRGSETLQMLSSESDVLIAYATTPDYVSWRDKKMGSIYIEVLCELLRLEGTETKLTELLQKVSNYTAKCFAVSRLCQVPCYTSSLSKSLVFNLKKRVVMVMYNDGTYSNVSNTNAQINATHSSA